MNRLLITGSSGFIARHAIPELLRGNYQVHAVDLHPNPPAENLIPHQIDLLNPQKVSRLMEQVRPTHLMHFAWYAEHGKFWTSPKNLEWVAASLQLLKSFTEWGGRRAVFAGSCAEYDWSHPHLVEDQTPSNPATLYGVAKNALRLIAQKYAGENALSLAWARLFFLYGRGEHPNRLIPSILNPLLNDQPAIVRNGSHVRDLMHVQDVARAFAMILDSAADGVINVATGDPTTLAHVAQILARLTNKSEYLKIENHPGTPANPQVMTADVAKLRSLGFAPSFTLEQGLTDVAGV